MFWKDMGKHNLVLWLDYTDEATTYHTLDMSMWGAVRYRRTFSYDDCNLVQSSPLITSIPNPATGHRCRFTRAMDSSQSSGMTHKLLTLTIGCVIPLPTSSHQ